MVEQGGDLILAPTASGATFVMTLPRVPVATRQLRPVRVPAQRALAARPHAAHEVPVA